MKEKIINAYEPPEHFEEVEKLLPVVQEASDDKTELWLIRVPANEVGPADLQEKRVKLNVDTQDGIVGHFYNSQGEEYNILKQGQVETLQPYAIIPNGADPLVVKKIACQVGFVKSFRAKYLNEHNSHHRSRDGVTEHEQTTSGLTSEKEQGGALLDVEKPSKKKRRRSEASEQK